MARASLKNENRAMKNVHNLILYFTHWVKEVTPNNEV
jgi:hypothetical protein